MQGIRSLRAKSRSIGPAYVATRARRINNAHLAVHRICRKVVTTADVSIRQSRRVAVVNSKHDASREAVVKDGREFEVMTLMRKKE
jgi:hypothetical protein